MAYIKHIFSADFVLIFGVFGIVFYAIFDAFRRKKWKWFILLLIIPLDFILVPLYLLFAFEANKDENRDDTHQTD